MQIHQYDLNSSPNNIIIIVPYNQKHWQSLNLADQTRQNQARLNFQGMDYLRTWLSIDQVTVTTVYYAKTYTGRKYNCSIESVVYR